jgi:intracellular proteinase inhibitor BsuPI
MIKRLIPALALVLAGAACGGEHLLWPSSSPLRLEVVAARTKIAVGDTTTVLFRVRNSGGETVRLTFGSSCQLLPYIARTDHQVVYPDGGHWVCLDVITELVLAPGEQKVAAIVIHGGSPAASGYSNVALEPGQYLMYATLSLTDAAQRSESLVFTVQ